MTAQVRTTSLCPACKMVLFLRTPIVVDEDGDTCIDRSDIEQATMIHLRMACPAVPRLHAHYAEVDEDEDVG